VKTVFVADSPAHAHLVSGLLEESGIRCVVEGEMLFGVRAEIGLTPASLPKVTVRDEDFERARAVIDAVDHAPADAEVGPPSAESASLRGFKGFLRVWVFVQIAGIAVVLALFAVWLFTRRS